MGRLVFVLGGEAEVKTKEVDLTVAVRSSSSHYYCHVSFLQMGTHVDKESSMVRSPRMQFLSNQVCLF